MDTLPTPTQVHSKADVRAFFNDFASENYERHGEAKVLLEHRLNLLDRHVCFEPDDVVLDVGCGDGTHLRALSDRIRKGIGIDLAPRMIERARRRTTEDSLTFRTDDAEHLHSIPESSVDVVICVGVLEHVLSPMDVFRAVRRVLKPRGRFVALTLNGTYWWYRVADQFRVPTRHLTTDRRFQPVEARRLLRRNGLRPHVDFWNFVPTGDLPWCLSRAFTMIDVVGRWVSKGALRGGLRLFARPA